MYYFIVNPDAGSGDAYSAWVKVQRTLERRRIQYEACISESPEQAEAYAREITARFPDRQSRDADSSDGQPDVIVVVGGGGTLNHVLNGLNTGRRFMLAFIPCGRFNDFAQDMHLKTGHRAPLRQVLNPRMNAFVDYGSVITGQGSGPRRFASGCGIGYTASIAAGAVESPPRRDDRKIPRVHIPSTSMGRLLRFHTTPGWIELDGGRRVSFRHIAILSVQIHRYECGLKIAPTADFSDGLFDICVVSGSSKILMTPTFASLFTARHMNMRGVHHYRSREVMIHTERAMPVHVDGEFLGYHTDLQLGCAERQLRVIM